MSELLKLDLFSNSSKEDFNKEDINKEDFNQDFSQEDQTTTDIHSRRGNIRRAVNGAVGKSIGRAIS